jgi:exopolyphosphatase/guanosine-5'-triphosphate,3'-diphosphate pyrophosphatase
MSTERRAVIDVGTNSIKLLVADVTGRRLDPVCEQSNQTRLGRGFYQTHELQREAIEQSASAVKSFASIARELGATTIRMIATSAARDARNAADLVSALESAAGVKVEIISGVQEAEWAFQGVTTDPSLADTHVLIMDLGGGSTEFVAGFREVPHVRHSFPLGTVRLLENHPPGDTPSAESLAHCREHVRTFLKTQVLPIVQPELAAGAGGQAWHKHTALVGTGGTATILGRMEAAMDDYDRERLEGLRMDRARVSWHVDHLWSMPLAQRQQIRGLPANRADVILTGTVIYEAVMECFQLPVLRISTRGLRWAALLF